ncbi:MAG: hypothetical protein E7366_00625 [Clostridiales bacterium]|nr:hypothetical protein [Clostridiales bacterium]
MLYYLQALIRQGVAACMEIYIEYALAENFLFDATLLYLSLKASKTPVRSLRLIAAALFGAVFAVIFPLLNVSTAIAYLLKFSVGFFLCLIAFPNVKIKNEWGRYALTSIFFFVFSFLFGGVLLGVLQEFFPKKIPSLIVIISFALLTIFSSWFIQKLYARRAIYRFIYDCEIAFKGRKRVVAGFLDSGNLAIKNGLPVCFLSADVWYDLFGEEILKTSGQVRDEITITTLGGEKTSPVFQGKIELNFEKIRLKKEVYFAPSGNMLSRGYKILLSARVIDEPMGRAEKEKRK